jgi:rhomboid protease GluP
MWQACAMRKGATLLRSGLDDARSNRYLMLLSAMSIDAAVERDGSGGFALFVAAADAEPASRLLADADAEHEARVQERHIADLAARREIPAPAGWFGRGHDAVLAIAGVCALVFMRVAETSDADTRSRLLALGAISDASIRAGEIWRFVTAVFLHFDIVHLVSNVAALLVVAPPLAHQVGALKFLVVFLVGGAGANVVSFFLAPSAGLKAGASGAIAAVLGALVGHRLRTPSSRHKPWQILAALAAFYGLTIGFGPGRDNTAHLAGVAIGLVLGRLMEPQALARDFVREPRRPSRSD